MGHQRGPEQLPPPLLLAKTINIRLPVVTASLAALFLSKYEQINAPLYQASSVVIVVVVVIILLACSPDQLDSPVECAQVGPLDLARWQ